MACQLPMQSDSIKEFVQHHFRHFNSATLLEAAEGYRKIMSSGGRMLVTLAGAMSTAESGVSRAEMIRCDKVHAISCTGANLEEDIFNLISHKTYDGLWYFHCIWNPLGMDFICHTPPFINHSKNSKHKEICIK